MQFITQLLVATATITTVYAASLTSLANSTLELVYSEEFPDAAIPGRLEFLSDPSLPTLDDFQSRIKPRCGTNQVHCDYSQNLAYTNTCQGLISAIQNNAGGDQSGVTSACYISTGICCAAWGHKISGLVGVYLINAMVSTFNNCNSNGRISGYASDVNLNGNCVNQCLSSGTSC